MSFFCFDLISWNRLIRHGSGGGGDERGVRDRREFCAEEAGRRCMVYRNGTQPLKENQQEQIIPQEA